MSFIQIIKPNPNWSFSVEFQTHFFFHIYQIMRTSNNLLDTLQTITGTGQFHSSGKEKFFLPGLQISGLGEVAFPLHPVMAEEIKKHAEAAPYGKGADTVLDESVRKCWQIDASHFQFDNPDWNKYLEKTTAAVAADLGVTGEVVAEPYKLLLYEKGGHFLAHRDTEKIGDEGDMFGTLIIALPSEHQGGQLLIRHDGQEITIDFSKPSKNHLLRHAAFFADCEHEVLPVTAGYRCCLVYNLRLKKGDPSRLNLALSEHTRQLLPHMKSLTKHLAGDFTAILLEHRYTEANLSLAQLKNNDRARGLALIAAAQEVGLTARLALVTFHQSGELEDGYDFDDYYSRGRRGRSRSSDEETMGEIYEESLSIDHWRDANDHPEQLGSWLINANRLITREKIGSGEPHEKEAEGFTGNAGCTMDYWYHHAAIVLTDPQSEELLLTSYNLDGAIQKLLVLSAKTHRPARFSLLGEAVIDALEKRYQTYHGYSDWRDNQTFQTTLQAIANQSDADLLNQLFQTLPFHTLKACDSKHWTLLLKNFGPASFTPLFQNLPADELEDHRHTLFDFLESLLAKGETQAATPIAPLLLNFQPKTCRQSSFSSYWTGRSTASNAPGDSHESHILLAASHFLEKATDRKKATTFLHGDRSLPHLRDTLAPALLKKTLAKHFRGENSHFPEFLAAAIADLEAETSRPLEPYPDWARPCPDLGKNNTDSQYYRSSKGGNPIKELQDFMANPDEQTHDFRYAQAIRTNLEQLIQNHHLDLDHATIKNTTPHILRCTKNSASHQRALKTRQSDHALLKKLRKLTSP